MAQPGLKRKRGGRWDDSSSESGYTSRSEPHSEEEEEPESDDEPVPTRESLREVKLVRPPPKRSRTTSTRNTSRAQSVDSGEDNMDTLEDSQESKARSRGKIQIKSNSRHKTATLPTRSLRPRPQRPDDDVDELSMNSGRVSDDDESFIPIIQSDVNAPKGRPRRGVVRPRLRQLTLKKSVARARSPDSDIEFEEPKRRSSRANKTNVSMRDDAEMDEESFYVTGDVGPGAPKIASVREVFQPPDSDSAFAETHIKKCHVCGGSRQRGQIVGCQGCSLSYHKACLGTRSAREHLVSKIGKDEFVLQCKFCINMYRKKDDLAPKHSMCQSCHTDGQACAPFSKRLTARQEEKLREQNDGVDPVTHVSPDLVNNAMMVMFRCTGCHRGWHIEHLPPARSSGIGTDVREERLKDYSIDWQCNECSSARYKIDKLVAWRPTSTGVDQSSWSLAFLEVPDDEKELFVKWDTKSYSHCTWMPGAWIHGTAAGASRMSFGKHDTQQSRLAWTDSTAFPEEYLMPDIVLKAKVKDGTARAKTKEEELANATKISKIFVKFQGLSYQEAVWDAPPQPDDTERWKAFESAYGDFVEGRYFQGLPQGKMRERIKAYRDEPFEEVEIQPAGLKRGNLMQYQVEGLNWLLGNFHSAKSVVLADEMGLGKTIQVISLVTSLVQDDPGVGDIRKHGRKPLLTLLTVLALPHRRTECHLPELEARVQAMVARCPMRNLPRRQRAPGTRIQLRVVPRWSQRHEGTRCHHVIRLGTRSSDQGQVLIGSLGRPRGG